MRLRSALRAGGGHGATHCPPPRGAVIETLVRCRRDLDSFEEKWNVLQSVVAKERSLRVDEASDGESLEQTLQALNETEIWGLLGKMPESLLRRALGRRR